MPQDWNRNLRGEQAPSADGPSRTAPEPSVGKRRTLLCDTRLMAAFAPSRAAIHFFEPSTPSSKAGKERSALSMGKYRRNPEALISILLSCLGVACSKPSTIFRRERQVHPSS